MLTYQVRQRVFRVQQPPLQFPNAAEVTFTFHPDVAFGNAGADGRTWKQSTPGSVIFNANTGQFKIDPKGSLNELDVSIEHSNIGFRLAANRLTITTHCVSNQELTQLVESIYYVLPLVLSLCFRDPLVIDCVQGRVGSNPFRWELTSWQLPILITNQKTQESRVEKAWELLACLSAIDNPRLVGALKYFYAAMRLRSSGHTPWEFMGEMLLNYCKVLEVLFPPSGDGKTRDAVRLGLNQLGYRGEYIEGLFLPVMLLRSKIDVGHVFLGMFTRQELTTLHQYTETVERSWLEMLVKVLERVREDANLIQPYTATTADAEAKSIVATIDAFLSRGPNGDAAA